MSMMVRGDCQEGVFKNVEYRKRKINNMPGHIIISLLYRVSN